MSAQLYLLDTNVVLALVRGKGLGRLIDDRYGLTGKSGRPLVSIVTHGEVRVLASRNGWAQPKLDYSQQSASGARNMGKNDLWIAACAKAAGATLLTTDWDFDHLSPAQLSVAYIDPKLGGQA